MKNVIYLIAIAAFAAAAEVENITDVRSPSSIAENAILKLRDQLPCGFPAIGVPPLAPFALDHAEINIEKPAFGLVGFVDNFNISGLNDFDVVSMNVHILKEKVTMELLFNDISLDTLYNLKMYLKKAGLNIQLIGDGRATFAIKHFRLVSTLKYSFGILTQKLKLKSIDIGAEIGEIESHIQGILGDGGINDKVNELLEDVVKTFVNENNELFSQTIQSRVFPIVNDVLDGYTVKDLIDIIGSGTENECKP